MNENEDSMTVDPPQPTIESMTEMILKWNETEVQRIGGLWKFGNKTATKLFTFLQENKLTLDEFNVIRFSSTARGVDEDYENYKIRRKFKKVLENYRKEVHDYLLHKVMEEQVKLIQEKQKEFNSSIQDTKENENGTTDNTNTQAS